MTAFELAGPFLALLPFELMLAAMVLPWILGGQLRQTWTTVQGLCAIATLAALASLGLQLAHAPAAWHPLPGLSFGLTSAWIALLVQGLGTVIAAFSARYLQGEPGQPRYVSALAGVLASVQVLLLADNWFVLTVAWAAAGLALHQLLCFYGDRPFAALAAHKKFLADRLADVLLVVAAWLAMREVGSASLTQLQVHVAAEGASTELQVAAVLLVLAVAIRTALLPVHGWLIQVMEAPTPVSALLHAGVVNLGGFVLIRFAPLLEAAAPARYLLVALGLVTAVLAGFVMLTRVSIKVRLAWSTLAQMGFMVVECGLGLYQLAALHIIGHSLYKAHAFLSSGETTRLARLDDLRGAGQVQAWSLWLAPVVASALVLGLGALAQPLVGVTWPWWWSGVLALAWAPMLWTRTRPGVTLSAAHTLVVGGMLVVLLTALASVAHLLDLGVHSQPHAATGPWVLVVMGLVYCGTALLQLPSLVHWLEPLRRQSYAGFYLDEAYTRLALYLWPVRLPATRHVRDANPAHAAAPSAAGASV